MNLAILARLVAPMMILTSALVGCAADEGIEAVDSSESALKNAPDGQVQVYNMNTHHLSEPGKPSFETTDFRQMIAYMKEQQYLPDVILLSEVGRSNEVPSQPCTAFVNKLEAGLSKKAKFKYDCEVARGKVSDLGNAGGGTAVVYRENMKPLDKIVLKNVVLQDGKCVEEDNGHTGLTFIQTFKDGNHTLAVASLHLVSPSVGDTPTGNDCSGANLKRITEALDNVQADLKIIGGDMNHVDAQRHLEGTTPVHDHWEYGYAHTVGFLAKGNAPNAGYKDPWFQDCAQTCGFKADPTATYNADQTQCVSACVMTLAQAPSGLRRIDWLLAKGASAITDNVVIPYEQARAAYVAQTGDQNAVAQYSDHHAQRFLAKY